MQDVRAKLPVRSDTGLSELVAALRELTAAIREHAAVVAGRSPSTSAPDGPSVPPTGDLNADQVAVLLGVDRARVYDLAKEGLPHFRLGKRQIRFDRQKVLEWREARDPTARNPDPGPPPGIVPLRKSR
jgi:excisionase family DNA binding protein